MRTEIPGRRTAPRIWLVQLAIVAIACCAATGGRSQSQGSSNLIKVTKKLVCPLSDAQTQDAIAAFAKMVPVFHHKRCANCHGGVDPFANPTNHAGGTRTRDEMSSGHCNDCHGDIAPPQGTWQLPILPASAFVGKDARSLCKLMKTAFDDKDRFVGHMQNDNGGTNFQGMAFAGTRALNLLGRAYVDNYQDEPIEIMHLSEFVQDARDWVHAMGDKFQGDIRCGCEPVHFAVRVSYHAMINVGPVQLPSTMGPVDIPITFHEDGTYEGTGTLPFSATGIEEAPIIGPCSIQSQGSMQIKVSGTATEVAGTNDMKVELTNTSPETGSTAVGCPMMATLSALKGGEKATFRFELAGKDGESSEMPVPLGPVVDAKVSVQLVDLDQGKSSPASE